jgi:hypothetical protein
MVVAMPAPSTSEPASTHPPVTDGYQRARRQAGIVAALVFGWELIGIRLSSEQELAGTKIQLTSPEAIPWALICLLCLFYLRLHLEWRQCDRGRRADLAARLDFILAQCIAVSAVMLFAYQKIGKEQLFEQLAHTPGLLLDALIGAVVVGGPGFYWVLFKMLVTQRALPRPGLEELVTRHNHESVDQMLKHWDWKLRESRFTFLWISAAGAVSAAVKFAFFTASVFGMLVGASALLLMCIFLVRETPLLMHTRYLDPQVLSES